MPLLAAGCRLYNDELLNKQTVSSEARETDAAFSEPECGDGKISGTEKCDTGIARGAPGACPMECPPLAACAPRALRGKECQAECALLVVTCGERDDCCPAECAAGSDDDCSNACGDGKIDAERGETCENGSQTPCPARDADCDDDDPCTTDRLLGSAKNCSALCVHLQNNTPKPNDSCCPPGADPTQDSDCKADCSGATPASREACDGSADCSKRCSQPEPGDDSDAGAPDALCGPEQPLSDCQRCSCERCVDTYLDCRHGLSAADSALCSAVLECAERARCTGDACYCGSVPTIPACLLPNGPCMQEIEMAAGTTDPDVIRQRSQDRMTPLGRATAAGTCRESECNGACFGQRSGNAPR